MMITIDAIYEDGVLKLKQRLDLPEGSRVRVLVASPDDDPLANVIGICDGPEDAASKHDECVYGKSRE